MPDRFTQTQMSDASDSPASELLKEIRRLQAQSQEAADRFLKMQKRIGELEDRLSGKPGGHRNIAPIPRDVQ